MTSHATRSTDPPWVIFRKTLIARLDRVDPGRFRYLDASRIIHVCPVCRAGLPEYLVVRFHGEAPRADIYCSLGCPDDALARALGIEVRP